jgi:serine/threonine-protein kinase RsbW
VSEHLDEQLTITSETEHLAKVREFLQQCASRAGLPGVELGKIVLAVDEATANIMKHAYGGQPGGEIHFAVKSDGKRLEVSITDHGEGFDPDRIKDPDMAEHVRAGRKSGLGIFLMRQIMDEVTYTFREGVPNRLRLVKYLTSASEE